MEKDIKYRHEIKYICNEQQIAILTNRLNALLVLDPHAKDGMYNIRSMYFDNFDNRCYQENLSGVNDREKYRIRIYNQDDSRITLECKKKQNGMTNKTSCPLSISEFEMLFNCFKIENLQQKPDLLRKFSILQQTQLFKPSIIVDYDRIPYVYPDGNVRITIDQNICSSSDFSDFFKKNIHNRPIQNTGYHLLEVKYDEFLPKFIKDALQLRELQQTTFSKYFLCKKFSTGGLL